MPILAILAGIAAVSTVAGALFQFQGAQTQAKAAKQQADASAHSEDVRQQQVALEAESQRRQTIRNEIAARSASTVAAQSHGALMGSGYSGGQGQIANQTGQNILGINQSQDNSNKIFSNNRQIAQAGALAAWGQGLSSMGSSIASAGQAIGGLKFGS